MVNFVQPPSCNYGTALWGNDTSNIVTTQYPDLNLLTQPITSGSTKLDEIRRIQQSSAAFCQRALGSDERLRQIIGPCPTVQSVPSNPWLGLPLALHQGKPPDRLSTPDTEATLESSNTSDLPDHLGLGTLFDEQGSELYAFQLQPTATNVSITEWAKTPGSNQQMPSYGEIIRAASVSSGTTSICSFGFAASAKSWDESCPASSAKDFSSQRVKSTDLIQQTGSPSHQASPPLLSAGIPGLPTGSVDELALTMSRRFVNPVDPVRKASDELVEDELTAREIEMNARIMSVVSGFK